MQTTNRLGGGWGRNWAGHGDRDGPGPDRGRATGPGGRPSQVARHQNQKDRSGPGGDEPTE